MNPRTAEFEQLVKQYIQQLDRSSVTKESYYRILTNFIEYLHSIAIVSPTKEDVIVYKTYLKKEKSLSPNTIQKIVVVLRGFFQDLAANDIYPNIMLGIRGEKISKDFKRSALSIKEVKRLINRASKLAVDIEGKRNYAIVSLIATTGLRTIEVERANKSDLSMKEDTHVLYIQGKGRDDKSDYVKISISVYKIIEDYLLERNDDEDALFITHSRNTRNNRLTTRNIRGIIKELLRQIDIDDPRYSAHSLRHSFATNLIKSGGSLDEAQLILRHRDASRTMIYVHALDRESSDGELKMSDMLFNPGGKK